MVRDLSGDASRRLELNLHIERKASCLVASASETIPSEQKSSRDGPELETIIGLNRGHRTEVSLGIGHRVVARILATPDERVGNH